MVKILQHLTILKMWYLKHAEHHAKNRTSLCSLDQETLFFLLTPDMSQEVSSREPKWTQGVRWPRPL